MIKMTYSIEEARQQNSLCSTGAKAI